MLWRVLKNLQRVNLAELDLKKLQGSLDFFFLVELDLPYQNLP